MAPKGLEAWQDATLQPEPLTPEEVVAEEARRLYNLHQMAMGAARIPRRLGGEATARELAKDKSTSRRVAFAASQLYGWWGALYSEDEDQSRASAQVVWLEWWEEHVAYLDRREAWIATWGLQHDHATEANRYLVLLERERTYLENIFK